MNQEIPPECSQCGKRKKRYTQDGVTVWKCMNVNAHDAVKAIKARSGGARPGAGRKKKKK